MDGWVVVVVGVAYLRPRPILQLGTPLFNESFLYVRVPLPNPNYIHTSASSVTFSFLY